MVITSNDNNNNDETYFDFEASTVLEREAIIATLMVVLDYQNHHQNKNNKKDNENEGLGEKLDRDAIEDDNDSYHSIGDGVIHPEDDDACLSPGKRTRIFYSNSNQMPQDEDDDEGTEMALSYFGQLQHHKEEEEDTCDESDEQKVNQSNRNNRKNRNLKNKKPLRQRQIQPEKDGDEQQLRSPPRSMRVRTSLPHYSSASSSRNNNNGGNTTTTSLKKPLTGMLTSSLPRSHSLKGKFQRRGNTNDKHQHRRQGSTDANENDNNLDDDKNHQQDAQPQATKVIAMKPSNIGEDFDDPHDVSYEVVLPTLSQNFSHLSLTPPRIPNRNNNNNNNNQVGHNHYHHHIADDASVREVMTNQQGGAWCSDDICTSALRDIAQSCTGIWDQTNNCGTNSTKSVCGGSNTIVEVDEERAHVEEYIADALGGQTCALGVYGGDVWTLTKSQHPKNNGESDSPARRIKNRASLLNAQAIRLRALRNEMTFAAALKRSKERMHYVQTTKSFDDIADNERIRQAQERSVNRLHTSALMGQVMGNMVFQQQTIMAGGNNNNIGGDDDTFYYDSDPEDVRVRTKGVRRASANRGNTVTVEEQQKLDQHHQNQQSWNDDGFEQNAFGKKLRKLDEHLIIQIVQVRYTMRTNGVFCCFHCKFVFLTTLFCRSCTCSP